MLGRVEGKLAGEIACRALRVVGSCLSDWVTLFLMTERDAHSHKHTCTHSRGGGEAHSGAVHLEQFLDEWDVTTALPGECLGKSVFFCFFVKILN